MGQPKTPQYQPPADDPATQALKQQAQQDQTDAVQEQLQIDSASLLARYGSRLTIAAAGGASSGPVVAGASPTMAPGGGFLNTAFSRSGA